MASGFTSSLATDYICDLTQADVEDVISHYSLSGDFDDIEPYITKPLDCDLIGDTCDLMGGVRAVEFYWMISKPMSPLRTSEHRQMLTSKL